MPKLIIDDREIEVEDGIKVIEAAERLGIMIPRFCYHPALGAVGACRVCAVKFVQGPFKGVQMSCMIDCKDGMVVSTTDEEALDFRRHVIEWLMLHHPHDCPVCDEGGHCLLQDMTVSGGHGLRRYRGPKRTYIDQNLGPLVQHEMNRCIQCYRCSRFYQEYAGYRDLGALQIANRTYFGRYEDGVLESPFAGNLSDLCPTGVYTDKPSRYKGRRWDYERTPSICIHCSLGCHIVVSARYREIVRHEARFSPEVNGHFICDRGRFGFYYTEETQRPRSARSDGEAVDTPAALEQLTARLDHIFERHGPAAVAAVGSVRSDLQTQAALGAACRVNGWQGPAVFATAETAQRVRTAVRSLEPELAVSMQQIEAADFVLMVGADPLNEAPMLALALRQAQRRGATVAAIDPRPIELPLAFEPLPAAPGQMQTVLEAVLCQAIQAEAADRFEPSARSFFTGLPAIAEAPRPLQAALPSVAARLAQSRRPLLVCGTDVTDPDLIARAADAVRLLQGSDKAAGLFYILPGAGAFGAGLVGDGSIEEAVAGIEANRIRALLVVQSDPLECYPDRSRLEAALNRLELLAVLDAVDTEAVGLAHIFLPTATVYETGGMFINQEGRLQKARPAYRGGISIQQTGGGNHPPRVYAAEIPGSDPQPAAALLAQLTGSGKRFGPDRRPASLPALSGGLTGIPEDGVRVDLRSERLPHFAPRTATPSESPEGTLSVLTVDRTFGTEALSSRSPCLRALKPSPWMYLHSEDARRLQLSAGDNVSLETGRGRLVLPLRTSSSMAAGVVILPRHRDCRWQILDGDRIEARQIRKTKDPTPEDRP
jgi:NADH-quinone oxidoreductase subunit G